MSKPEPFHPDVRAARWFPRAGVSRRTLRLFRKPPRPRASTADVDVSTLPIPTTGGELAYRVYRPRAAGGSGPAFFWIHGGGLVMGSPQQDDRFLIGLAQRLGIVVFAASYRLAPEHPAPAALEDLSDGWHEIRGRAAEWGVDPDRIAIGGGSAGGGLAAALTQRLHDEGTAEPVFQLLLYPMLDDRTVLRTDIDTRHVRIWPPSSNRFGWESYLGAPAGSPNVPRYAVPARRDDLAGLPPSWIGVGTLDLFHDEDLAYAKRLRDAGVTTEVFEIPGVFHGFDAVFRNARVTSQFHSAAAEALRKALEP